MDRKFWGPWAAGMLLAACMILVGGFVPTAGAQAKMADAKVKAAEKVAALKVAKAADVASAKVRAEAKLTKAEAPASQPESAPAPAQISTPPIVNLNDPASIVRGVVWAWQHRAWPYLVLLLLGGLLFLERHYKGAFGSRSSAWLGSRKGILITSLIAGLVSGCMTAALSGWKGLGWAALAALGTGLLNAAAQKGSNPPTPTALPVA